MILNDDLSLSTKAMNGMSETIFLMVYLKSGTNLTSYVGICVGFWQLLEITQCDGREKRNPERRWIFLKFFAVSPEWSRLKFSEGGEVVGEGEEEVGVAVPSTVRRWAGHIYLSLPRWKVS